VSRKSRRAAAIAVVGVFAVAPLVSACAAGEHPQSALPTQLGEGVNASAQQVDIRNAFLLGPSSGQRLAAGGSAPLYAWFVNNATSPDRLVAVEAPGVAQSVEIAGGAVDLPPGKLVTTVQSPGASQSPSATPSLTPTPSGTKSHAAKPRLTPGARRSPNAATSASGTPTPGAPTGSTPAGVAPVAPPPSPATSSKVILKGLTKDYSGGETVRLTLHFQQAGTISLNIPVVPRNGYYATYSPAPVAPTATPSATPPLVRSTPAGKSTTQKTKAQQARSKKRPSATPSA
jgi:copper(I)-binding protein